MDDSILQRVIYLEMLSPEVISFIKKYIPERFEFDSLKSKSEDEIFSKVKQADYIIVGSTPISGAHLSAASRLKFIQHQGVGFDNLDVDAIKRYKIPVAINPFGTTAVAEHTILLILSVCKRLPVADRSLREGRWLVFELRPHSFELSGKTLGILGFGRNGRELAKMLSGFNIRILYYDKIKASEEVGKKLKAEYCDLHNLLSQADILTIHVDLNEETKGMIGEKELGLMKKNAVIINTSRGDIIDEKALINSLESGKIAGAGLDVFHQEPLPMTNPLIHMNNVVLTPHIAAGTQEVFHGKMKFAFENITRVANGEQPLSQVLP